MAIYCGVDFHARQQTVCYCDTTDGAVQLAELDHQADDVRGFYCQFAGEVIVGIEDSGYSTWFVEPLEGLGHQVLIGDAAEVRRLAKRRQKNDRPTDECEAAVEAVLSPAGGDEEGATRVGRLKLVPLPGAERRKEPPGPELKRMLDEMRRRRPAGRDRGGRDTGGKEAA